ncbi:Hypothetical protein GbCGDNIH1_7281 [Granulibacter bethesdensis CGDNIH1]|uniref:Uncharacterized protein n=1 Tax=Granulibacter bethesdensis (strain ATCC BAA-1260 / CGDNIH1) TaxID=391165 RepID=A0A286M2X9_GRABC|nr:Hypothetical protein GbCGDNIH5_7281 [Granulibacter bethesdensis]APH64058.1 Hypothetical protein GbCGDNIH1I4_7281 [Granulibacter bethesdensis]ASV62378.1 Hypothetical protein GbCGDNIH1_7281 [Granulibacter bethesdensis CGDNIH1]
MRAAGQQRGCGRIKHHEIGLLPFFQRTNPVAQAENGCTASRRQIKCSERIETGSAQLAGLIGRTHRMQQGEARSRSDIRAETNADTVLFSLLQIEQAGAEKTVGCRAEGNAGLCLGQRLKGACIKLYTMRENGSGRQQAEPRIHVEIVPIPCLRRKPLCYSGAFGHALGQMRMKQCIGIGTKQIGSKVQLGIRAGQCITRHDGVAEPIAAMPPFDQPVRVIMGGFDRIMQMLRAEIHQNFAGNDPHVACTGGCKQGVD